jgi:hypothetical protein
MCAGVLDDPGLDPDTFRLTVSISMAVYPADGSNDQNLWMCFGKGVPSRRMISKSQF